MHELAKSKQKRNSNKEIVVQNLKYAFACIILCGSDTTSTTMPTTPIKKEKEKVVNMVSEAITNDFLMKKMMQDPKMLKEYLDYLQKQDKNEETDKIEESAGSSESTFDPFGGPCGQDPNDF